MARCLFLIASVAGKLPKRSGNQGMLFSIKNLITCSYPNDAAK